MSGNAKMEDWKEWSCLWAGLDAASKQLPLTDDFFGERFEEAVKKRKYNKLRATVNPRSKLEEFFLELFILSRSPRKVLAYLSVQEGENFDDPIEGFDTNAPIVIRDLLRRVGRAPQLKYTKKTLGIPWRISLDPSIFLRRLYWNTLRPSFVSKVLGSQQVRVLRFRVTCWLLSKICFRLKNAIAEKERDASIANFLKSQAIDRPIAMLLLVIFADVTRDWSRKDWSQLLNRIKSYLEIQVPNLTNAISQNSGNNRGYIKLAKVSFGVLICRARHQDDFNNRSLDYVFDSIRLAYSWGITYPLVDNVIDDPEIPKQTKKAVLSLVGQVFSEKKLEGTASKLATESPLIAELTRRLLEVRELIRVERREHVFPVVNALIRSHQIDTHFSLNDLQKNNCSFDQTKILINAASKAAAIRLATLAVCGGEINNETVTRYLNRGFFNQLGDDIWDLSEDCRDGRVTPVTYAKETKLSDPVLDYLQYTSWLVKGERPLRRSAAFLGCCEVLRDSIHLSEGTEEQAFIAELISASLAAVGIRDAKSFLDGVPPIDTDSTLFLLEDAIKECLSGPIR